MAFYLRQLELILEFKHSLMFCRAVNRSGSKIMVGVSMLGENAIHCQSRETKFGLAGLGYQLNKKS